MPHEFLWFYKQFGATRDLSVSYTHLDVYKRQLQIWSPNNTYDKQINILSPYIFLTNIKITGTNETIHKVTKLKGSDNLLVNTLTFISILSILHE